MWWRTPAMALVLLALLAHWVSYLVVVVVGLVLVGWELHETLRGRGQR